MSEGAQLEVSLLTASGLHFSGFSGNHWAIRSTISCLTNNATKKYICKQGHWNCIKWNESFSGASKQARRFEEKKRKNTELFA